MDFDVMRAIDFIVSGDMATEKANQSSSFGPKGMLNTVKQYYSRSKSPNKNRKTSPAQTAEVINVSEDDYEEEQMRLAMEMSLQDSGMSSSHGCSPNLTPSNVGPIPVEQSSYFGPA